MSAEEYVQRIVEADVNTATKIAVLEGERDHAFAYANADEFARELRRAAIAAIRQLNG